MSGHSKWSTIKRKKGSNDAARGKIFSKISKEIIIAVKDGGPSPDNNTKLRDAIIKARAENMPNTNVERAIKKGAGDSSANKFEELSYEGYSPGGGAIFVACLTDNKNRTGPEVRNIFNKNGGNLGENGCVSYLFSRKGIIACKSELDEEAFWDLLLETETEDIQKEEDEYMITTAFESFSHVLTILETQSCTILHAELSRIPESYIDLSEEDQSEALTLIEQLENLEDVQSVFHNLQL